MAIPGAFPRIAIRTFTLSIKHLHIQYSNMAIKTTHSNFFFIFSSPVEGEEVKEVVVRAAGKAVDLVALGIEAHGGIPVKVGRVQTAEPLAGIDALVVEVVDDPGTERVEGVGHGTSPFWVWSGVL